MHPMHWAFIYDLSDIRLMTGRHEMNSNCLLGITFIVLLFIGLDTMMYGESDKVWKIPSKMTWI